MATNRNIQMNYYNGTDYDVLYPQSTPEQTGSLSINGGTVNGDIILNQQPTNGNACVSKSYVDSLVGGGLNKILLKSYQINLSLKGVNMYTMTTIGPIADTFKNFWGLTFVFKNISIVRTNIVSGLYIGLDISSTSPTANVFIEVPSNNGALSLSLDALCVFVSSSNVFVTEDQKQVIKSPIIAKDKSLKVLSLSATSVMSYIGMVCSASDGEKSFSATLEIYGLNF